MNDDEDKEVSRRVNERMIQMEFENKRKEESKKIDDRRKFIEEALRCGITRDMLRFLEENFEKKGHEHWDGRIG